MAFNMIETPGIPNGDENQRLENIYRYLCRMADDLNIQLGKIGSNDLTDEERQIMMQVIRETSGPAAADAEITDGMAQMESLKSMIVKTAKFVQTKLQEYRTSLLRETVAEGQFGKYVRNTGLDVVVNPEGVTQTFKFSEVVQGLRNFEVFAKNYIKTGLLREESSIPIYGLQIGKDIVTFSEDGTETYHDGNKALEVLADAINFFSGGNKVFYITSGKIHSNGDLEIESGGKLKVKSGGTLDVDSTNFKLNSDNKTINIETTNFKIDSNNKTLETGMWKLSDNGLKGNNVDGGHLKTFELKLTGTTPYKQYQFVIHNATNGNGNVALNIIHGITNNKDSLRLVPSPDNNEHYLGDSDSRWGYAYIDDVYYKYLLNNSSKEVKHDIEPMQQLGEKLDQLQPVTFIYDDDPKENKRFGLIYEDTVEVMPEICTKDESNKAINYVEIIPMLLKEIQELRARIKALEEREE